MAINHRSRSKYGSLGIKLRSVGLHCYSEAGFQNIIHSIKETEEQIGAKQKGVITGKTTEEDHGFGDNVGKIAFQRGDIMGATM